MHALPACCTPLREHWPLPRPLTGACLVSTCFDPALLAEEDFAACGIPRPRGISKRQAEFLAGRLCARSALQRLTGTASVPAVGDDRAPQWPAGISGSITHSHGRAAAVVARQEHWLGLGLDLERLLEAKRARLLAREVLTASEQQRLAGLPEERQALLVTLSFSLKESLFKALYPLVGRRFYFEHAELLDWSEDGQARLRLLSDLAADWPRGRELQGQFARLDDQLLSLVAIAADQPSAN